MPYTGSGANKVPIGKINPILLGQKKDAHGGGQPSLLSQHLSKRKDTDYSNQGYKDQQSEYKKDGQWNSQQGGYNQPGGYNQQGNFNQQGSYNQPGNYNQKGSYSHHGSYNQGNYNSQSQGYGDQSSNYGDSRRTANQPPQPLMSIGTQQGQPPYNQNQGFGPGGMNFGMAPLPSGAPPGFGPANFPAPPAGFAGPPPPAPPSNQSFNQPPPPPSHGGPPPPPGGSKFTSEPPNLPPLHGSKFSSEPPGLPPQGMSKFSLEPPAPPLPPSNIPENMEQPCTPPRKRKRRSRWGDVEEKTNIPGMPASLPSNVTQDQKEQYLLHFKIEEISIKLRSGDLGIPANPEDRSPSPEPIYNTEGKRLNTREFRVRKALEEERHMLIQRATDIHEDYKPPIDYRPPSNRIQEKVMIPQDANPAINFIGLLIGPRGNTLKKMEKETNCKIIIRGKGSVKEGKGRPGFPLPGENEPLHALVTGPTHEEVKNAVKVIEKIVKEGVETPEGSNELRKMQLRELAALNGTLIEEDIARCRNCGATDHRHWECTEVKNVTSQVICTKCGGYGHLAKDCVYTTSEGGTATPQPSVVEKAKMDDEYMSLMAELGVDAPAGSSTTTKSTPTPAPPSTQHEPANVQNTVQTKPFSAAPAPWNAPARPLMSSDASASFSQRASTTTTPKPLMQSFVSNGPPSSSSQWKPPSGSGDQFQKNPGPVASQSGAPWSQQGSNMGQQNGMRGMPPSVSSAPSHGAPPAGPPRGAAPAPAQAPPPWQAAPPPWQQAQPAFPPASGYGMPPMGVMYPQMGQTGPPMPPWAAPPPPPPPPSK